MGGTLLTNRGVTGFSQYGETYSLLQEPYEEYVDLSASPIALPTSEPADANLSIEVLASHVPTIYPSNAVNHMKASPTYGDLYKTYYEIIFENSTGASITCSRKYVSNPATPTWSSAATFEVDYSSRPRWTSAVSTGMNIYHAVGTMQGFKFWAASAGVSVIGYYKVVFLTSQLTTPNNGAVADFRIQWGIALEKFKTASSSTKFTLTAGYPVYGSSPGYYSTTVSSSNYTIPFYSPFYIPHPTSGIGAPENVAWDAYSNTSDVLRGFIYPKHITCRIIR